MIDQGEAPHDETKLVHRDLLKVTSDVLNEVETREDQDVVLGQELEAIRAE